ncbi:helix-turn-helix transcriptional regulator [Campylobacter sp. faydin G-24]|uniref:Helix-turn-helix transcriptional regulator n=1 Tax=Campylobacter anatolicus TaxID=2829105 RepID=A0ABS5HL22_9BACT|nr:helix-turn-helix transcriptional regulator [Campylobacter anatolicus]MBR8464427.1 helix-turn-helix transcriptional regulator [Campylobacter anatolicus]
MAEENIVKRVCSELGITQRELAERLGLHITAVQKWVANADDLPLQTQKVLELVLENHHLKSKVEKIDKILNLIDELKQC